MYELIPREKLWRYLLDKEPPKRHRAYRFVWGGMMYWLIEKWDAILLGVSFAVVALSIAAVLLLGLCMIGGCANELPTMR